MKMKMYKNLNEPSKKISTHRAIVAMTKTKKNIQV